MYRFLIVIENAGANFSAYSPDLPGCVTTGKTREETEKNMHEAIQLHIEGMLEDGLSIPQSSAAAEYIVLSPPATGLRPDSEHSQDISKRNRTTPVPG